MVGEYCDRIAVMYQGKIVETGLVKSTTKVKSVFEHPRHEYTQSLLQAALHIQVDTTEEVQTVSKSAQLLATKDKAPILKVKDLKQYFTLEAGLLKQLFTKEKNYIKAVDNVSFELHQGEILGLVGESGCGKSTLSRTILQLIQPTNGTVEFLGEDLTKLSSGEIRQIRRQMQMIFQDPHACLNPLMKVGESIADPLFIHGLATSSAAKKKVEKMLERVGLTPVDDYYHRYPSDLSGGQQQRVAIARALITEPQLIICDEPVSMLDASVQTQVLDLMLDLKSEFNLTYLFITHDLWVARFLCDRIAVMNRGKIVEIGSTADIFNHPQDPYTQKLLQAAPLLSF